MKTQGIAMSKNTIVESIYSITKKKTVTKEKFSELIMDFSGSGYFVRKGSYIIDCYQFKKPTTVDFTLINNSGDTVDFHIQHLEVGDYVNKVYTVVEKKLVNENQFDGLMMVYKTSNFGDYQTYKRSGYVSRDGVVVPYLRQNIFPDGVKLEEAHPPREAFLKTSLAGSVDRYRS